MGKEGMSFITDTVDEYLCLIPQLYRMGFHFGINESPHELYISNNDIVDSLREGQSIVLDIGTSIHPHRILYMALEEFNSSPPEEQGIYRATHTIHRFHRDNTLILNECTGGIEMIPNKKSNHRIEDISIL